jgi:hypothetical protein
MLPELIKTFVHEEETLFACSCSLIDAKDIIVERSLLMNRNHIISDSTGAYKGHWANGLLKLWVANE